MIIKYIKPSHNNTLLLYQTILKETLKKEWKTKTTIKTNYITIVSNKSIFSKKNRTYETLNTSKNITSKNI